MAVMKALEAMSPGDSASCCRAANNPLRMRSMSTCSKRGLASTADNESRVVFSTFGSVRQRTVTQPMSRREPLLISAPTNSSLSES